MTCERWRKMEREGGGGIEGERMEYGGGDGERERKINFAMCIDMYMYHSIVIPN